MTIIISKMEVKDYASWATKYENGADSRRQFGVKTLAYGQDRAAQGVVFVVLDVENEELARQLLDHPALRKNIEEQGVQQRDLIFLDP